jgi:hypothetical protein
MVKYGKRQPILPVLVIVRIILTPTPQIKLLESTGSREFLSSLHIPHVLRNGTLLLTAKSGEENRSLYTSYKQQINSLVMQPVHLVSSLTDVPFLSIPKLCEYTSRSNAHKLTAEYSLRGNRYDT